MFSGGANVTGAISAFFSSAILVSLGLFIPTRVIATLLVKTWLEEDCSDDVSLAAVRSAAAAARAEAAICFADKA